MTLKRKLSLAAVLVVFLAMGLAVLLCGRDPDSPIAATFVRYQYGKGLDRIASSNGVWAVMQIVNKSGADLIYVTHFTSMAAGAGSVSGVLGPHEVKQEVVQIFEAPYPPPVTLTARISVECFQEPARLRRNVAQLLSWLGIRIHDAHWETSIDLPP